MYDLLKAILNNITSSVESYEENSIISSEILRLFNILKEKLNFIFAITFPKNLAPYYK